MDHMAKIVHSETAPSESVHYDLGGVAFDLGGKTKSYATTDPAVLANAEVHPWLTVERDPADSIKGVYRDQLAPEDDVLSAINSKANDPKAVAAAQEEVVANDSRTAIDAGKDQDTQVVTGGVAETLAADAAADSKDSN